MRAGGGSKWRCECGCMWGCEGWVSFCGCGECVFVGVVRVGVCGVYGSEYMCVGVEV